jgi:hypothetical protein
MPQKFIADRLKRARKHGVATTLKRTDVSGPTERSAHGAKKSSQLTARVSPTRRNASVKSPPGHGHSGELALKTERAAAYEKREQREKRPRNRKEHPQKMGRRGLVPQGRKKAPSRIGVKGKGGPFKTSRLHGG